MINVTNHSNKFRKLLMVPVLSYKEPPISLRDANSRTFNMYIAVTITCKNKLIWTQQ